MTDAARSDENTPTRMAKSNRSRDVIYESGGHLSPTVARMSEAMDGDGIREPEYAERTRVSAHECSIGEDGPYKEESAELRG